MSINTEGKNTKDIYITFDLDWAADFVLNDTLDLIEKHDISATFFITHNTSLLNRMRENPKIELGIHPNFNDFLTNRISNTKTVEDRIKELIDIVPEAKCIRSHSLFQQSNLLRLFIDFGIKKDLNMLIPRHSKIELKPFMFFYSELLRIPYFWEDDTHCLDILNRIETLWDPEKWLMHPGLKIFNFHPIHVYLNTENLNRYESGREFLRCEKKLREKRLPSNHVGTRSFLLSLINRAKNRFEFKNVRDISI